MDPNKTPTGEGPWAAYVCPMVVPILTSPLPYNNMQKTKMYILLLFPICILCVKIVLNFFNSLCLHLNLVFNFYSFLFGKQNCHQRYLSWDN